MDNYTIVLDFAQLNAIIDALNETGTEFAVEVAAMLVESEVNAINDLTA